MTVFVQFEIIHNHIGLMTLHRPENANALSKAMLDEINNVVEKINHHPNIYSLIITGSGDNVFCAGADLKERRGMSEEQVASAVQYISKTMSNIEKISVPVIAAINGHAFGGGLELALACDLRVAVKYAKMGLTETSLAIIPGAGGTQRLPRLIGIGKAKEMIFSAQPITGHKAFEIGLVEQIVETDALAKAIEIAKRFINNGPIALKQAKLAINQGIQTDLSTGLMIEHLSYKETIPTEDRMEGLVAFKEKRKPMYRGK